MGLEGSGCPLSVPLYLFMLTSFFSSTSLLFICSFRTKYLLSIFIILAFGPAHFKQILTYPIELFNTLLSSKLFKGLNYQNLFCSNNSLVPFFFSLRTFPSYLHS